MAIGMLVVPTWKRVDEGLDARDEVAQADARAMAAKIQSGQVAVEERQFFGDASGHYAAPPALRPAVILAKETLRPSMPLSMKSGTVYYVLVEVSLDGLGLSIR